MSNDVLRVDLDRLTHLAGQVDTLADAVTERFEETADVIRATIDKDSAVFAPHYYVSLAAAPQLPYEFRNEYDDLFSDDGTLESYNEIFKSDVSDDESSRRRSELTEMFNRFGIQQGQETAMGTVYGEVRPKDG